ncbi:MAG: hypothetical protein L0228_14685 [Planctomycetes bacterium]|nr:hypothetical protein [Planctomycetota bacterium]
MLLGVAMMVAIALLWLRVRELETSVDSLTRQLQSRPGAFVNGPANFVPQQTEEKKKVFQLIDGAHPDNGETEVGVPWSVERGMMIDAAEHSTPRPEAPRFEFNSESPIMIDESPSILEQLRQSRPEQPPASSSGDGGFN